MTSSAPVSISFDDKIAWVEVNHPPVNATSTIVRAGLDEAVRIVEDGPASVAILICSGRTFIAGGDMSEFDAPPQPPHLPDVVTKIEDSRVPWIAAMHGTVLGGGFEIAMGCSYRIAAPDTRFGLPEVSVGLIPGAGGTQRLPRLVPMATAVDIACRGRLVSAADLRDLGAIDKISRGGLRADALAFANALPPRPDAVSQRPTNIPEPTLLETEREKLQVRAKGQASPLLNIDALAWSSLPFADGQLKERALHLDLRGSSESRALRHCFFAERDVAKPRAIEGVHARELERIAIVGGGLMGAGIATAALNAGYSVTVIERDSNAAEAARARVFENLERMRKRGRLTETAFGNQKSLLATAEDFSAAAGNDLAIEAVFEDVGVKRDVFSRLASVMSKTAILATNTSYLDPVEIFDGIDRPERCVGLHFFSPAHVMKLLEIVKTPGTSAETLATGFRFGKRLRKVAVLAGICDGFIGNRMLAAYRREAEYLLADGALPYQVDEAMRGFGYAMGPFEAQDMSGLQIAWANRKAKADEREPDQRYVTISDQLCEAGRLGQRNAKGWYDYAEGNRRPERSRDVEELIADYARSEAIIRRPYTGDEIAERLLAVLANEGLLIVEEGVAETIAAVDMVQIHGYGFPRWRGGPMHYANEIGLERTAKTMAKIATESPTSWTIAKELQN